MAALAAAAPAIPVSAQTATTDNPFIPKRNRVRFAGSGAGNFAPLNASGGMPGQPTPLPDCIRKPTQVGFQVECTRDSSQKETRSCNGSMSFYAFNLTTGVTGTISGDGKYTMILNSPDGGIGSCMLTNELPVSAEGGNTIEMLCPLSVEGCRGQVEGAGGNRAVSTSASVVVTPEE